MKKYIEPQMKTCLVKMQPIMDTSQVVDSGEGGGDEGVIGDSNSRHFWNSVWDQDE